MKNQIDSKTKLLYVKDIKPYPQNNKDHSPKQIEKLVRSIKRYGMTQPLAVDKNNVCVIGHARLEALKQMDYRRKIQVVDLSHLSKAEARKLRILDNKIASQKYNETNIFKEIDDLYKDLSDRVKISDDLGLSMSELLKMSPKEEDERDNQVPKRVKSVTKSGDLWELGGHRLLCGDSTVAKDVRKLMNKQRANMCFTDPPWNVAIGLDSNPRHRQREGLKNDKLDQKSFEEFLLGFIRNTKLILDGDIYCVLGNEQMPYLDALIRGQGFHWSAIIVWVKDIFVLGRSKYHRRYEPIWYGWLDKSSFSGDRKQDDVWEVKRPKRSQEHPTMKPVELMERAIINSSSIEGIVYEPFCGSGSTLIACEKTGRSCYSMELDQHYCDVIRDRYIKYCEVHKKKPEVKLNGKTWKGKTKKGD